MTEENKQLLVSRFKSLAWRLGAMVAVALVAFLAQNLELFHLNPQVQVFVGLVLGEITKWLNTKK